MAPCKSNGHTTVEEKQCGAVEEASTLRDKILKILAKADLEEALILAQLLKEDISEREADGQFLRLCKKNLKAIRDAAEKAEAK
jgi:hypothetical protein